MVSIVLFTRDLRVHDHPGLTAAAGRGEDVVPLFVLDPELIGRSANRARFLMESLLDLDRSLASRGSGLVLREGEAIARTLEVVRATGANSVHLTADVTGFAQRREAGLRAALSLHGVVLHVHAGNAVVEPGDVAPPGKSMYSVFTPYHRAWGSVPRRSVLEPPSVLTLPAGLDLGPRPDPKAVHADSIDLAPGGEGAGRRHLESYLARGASGYADARNDMAADATSRLSPYLRFGCISANELVQAAARTSAEFVRQLAWRDFYGQLLAHDPAIQWRDYREPPADMPAVPEHADYFLECWKQGRTGLPLVDAGMRQLRREGWMHNRARMVAASFLTRRLGIPWQEGAAHFSRWLVDGDPANNVGGWQWVAGTGTDPRRARSFSPVRQAARFDPDGAYVRRYVRELAALGPPSIFAPWKDPQVLRSTGYPAPIIEVPATKPSGPGAAPFRAGSPARPGQAHLFDEASGPLS